MRFPLVDPITATRTTRFYLGGARPRREPWNKVNKQEFGPPPRAQRAAGRPGQDTRMKEVAFGVETILTRLEIWESFARMKISWRGLPFLLLLLIAVFLGGCVSPDPDLTSGDQLLGAGNLRGAVDAFQRAYTKPQPEKEKAALAKRIEEIKRQITDSVLADARQATAQGANIPSLQQAAALLQRDVSYDDAARRLTTELTRASNRLDEMQAAYEAAVKEATAAERDDAWSRGVLALRKADLLNPSNEIKQRIESLINRRDKTVPARIEKLMDAQDLDAVQTEFEKYLAETPRPAGDAFSLLAAKVDFFRKKYLEARLDSLVQLNKYYTAFQLVRDSKRDYLDERMPEIRQQGAAFYKAKAAHEFDLGGSRLGYAFFAAEKAWELRPDDAAIFKLRREISDVVNAGITEQISIDVFTAKEKEDGIALSNTLMEHLLANRPYGIQILERAKIDELLKSQAAKRDLLLSKVKLWIVGDVTTLDVERQDSKREGTVEAKTGTRRIRRMVMALGRANIRPL